MNKKFIALTLALAVFGGGVSLASAATSTSTVSTPTLDVQCVSGAVDTLTTSLQGSLSTFSGSINTAFANRATAWKAALGQTTAVARRTGVRQAEKDFTTATRSARLTYNSARKAAWTAYRAAAKACQGGNKAPVVSNSGEGNL